MTPKYEHDCDRCVYLGEYVDDHVDDRPSADLYWCRGPIPTVVARWSSEPSCYTSGIAFIGFCPALTEAFARAYRWGHVFIADQTEKERLDV